MLRLEERLVGRQGRRVVSDRCGFPGKLHSEYRRNRLRDLVLHSEHVRQLPVISFRPEMTAVAGRDQLRGDPNPFARLPHTAFENVGHA